MCVELDCLFNILFTLTLSQDLSLNLKFTDWLDKLDSKPQDSYKSASPTLVLVTGMFCPTKLFKWILIVWPDNSLNFPSYAVLSPFSFLTLLIWILTLCLLISLDKGLSIFWIFFFKKQLLVSLILGMIWFYFIYLGLQFDYFLPSTPLEWVCFILF